jgi:hypothetical protein
MTGTYRRAVTSTTDTPVSIVVKNEEDLSESDNIFYLGNEDSLVITGVPEGMIYIIKELDGDEYTTSILGETQKVTDADGDITSNKYQVANGKTYDARSTGKNSPIVNGGNEVTFTNNLDITTPTGLVLKFGPQLLVLLIAIGGALVIFKTSKKNKAR